MQSNSNQRYKQQTQYLLSERQRLKKTILALVYNKEPNMAIRLKVLELADIDAKLLSRFAIKTSEVITLDNWKKQLNLQEDK